MIPRRSLKVHCIPRFLSLATFMTRMRTKCVVYYTFTAEDITLEVLIKRGSFLYNLLYLKANHWLDIASSDSQERSEVERLVGVSVA